MENEEDPLLEHEEKDDDDDGDTTNPFQPGGTSTPGEDIPMTTMNRGKEKEPSTAETSFIEGVLFHAYSLQMQKHGKRLQGYFLRRRPQNSRRPTAKKGSYKSKCLVKARGLILCLLTFGFLKFGLWRLKSFLIFMNWIWGFSFVNWI